MFWGGQGKILCHSEFGCGVVYSWDESCAFSDEWIRKNNIASCDNGISQPFYEMLFSDGTVRYCAQDSLDIAIDAQRVGHDCIPNLFRGFDGALCQYIPSVELAARFPDDMVILRKQLHELYS